MRRPGPPKEIPPPLELACLKMLWRLGEASVRDVHEALSPDRNLAYTTVLTVLDRLAKREAAVRKKQGRSFVYSPKISREVLRRAAVKELLADFFDGDTLKLQQFLSELPEEQAAAAAVGMDAALL